jgi:hypothetical protein
MGFGGIPRLEMGQTNQTSGQFGGQFGFEGRDPLIEAAKKLEAA